MSLVIQKFGGTSLADSGRIISAARKAIRASQQGHQVVMVVSAMGKNTDQLEKLAFEVNPSPPDREMDMLLSTGEQVSVALMAMAISGMGFKATSLTGGQIGIKTDSSHTKARIQSISTDRIKKLLEEGSIVIAAGFQGIDEELNITTLGRGGSDTTAVALAAVLQANTCEIYTDVDGVYTTDPRILPEASLNRQVSYNEMLELASLGAGVMHSRSIEFGKKFNVAIHVRSSLSDSEGSLIVDHSLTEDLPVSGAALTQDEARISILNVPDIPGTIHQLIAPICGRKITIDMIVQNVSEAGLTDVSFTVPASELTPALDVLKPAIEKLGGQLGTIDDQVAKVSVVGMGMASQSGVAGRMFKALAEHEVNLQMITTSEIKISGLVPASQAITALRAVHNEFELDKKIVDTQPFDLQPTQKNGIDALEVIDRLQLIGMESLTIDDIILDNSQSRITLTRVPNQVGTAAMLFQDVAAHGVFVDMIVQTYAHDQYADISFTVPRNQLESATAVAHKFRKQFSCESVETEAEITKLTVSGIGLQSHTGVALGTFEALKNEGINVGMINTSEVRVNVVINAKQASQGLECLQSYFQKLNR